MFLFQLSLIGAAFYLTSWSYSLNRPELQFYGFAVLFAGSIFPVLFFKETAFRRLKDIYPDLQLNGLARIFFRHVFFSPILAYLGLAFLCTKSKGSAGGVIPVLIRKPGLVALLSMMCSFGPLLLTIYFLFSPAIRPAYLGPSEITLGSYWLSNPTTFYITAVANETSELLTIKEGLSGTFGQDQSGNPNAKKFKELMMNPSFSSVGGVLKTAVLVSDLARRSKQIEREKGDKFPLRLELIGELIRVIEVQDRNLPFIYQLNPFLLFLGAGSVEASVTGLTAVATELKARESLVLGAERGIEAVRKFIPSNDPLRQKDQQDSLDILVRRLKATQSAKTIQNLKGSHLLANFLSGSNSPLFVGRGLGSTLALKKPALRSISPSSLPHK